MNRDVRFIREYRELTVEQRAVAARRFKELLSMMSFDDLAAISSTHLAMAFEVLDDAEAAS